MGVKANHGNLAQIQFSSYCSERLPACSANLRPPGFLFFYLPPPPTPSSYPRSTHLNVTYHVEIKKLYSPARIGTVCCIPLVGQPGTKGPQLGRVTFLCYLLFSRDLVLPSRLAIICTGIPSLVRLCLIYKLNPLFLGCKNINKSANLSSAVF